MSHLLYITKKNYLKKKIEMMHKFTPNAESPGVHSRIGPKGEVR